MLDYQKPFWRFTIFKYISASVILFVVMTSTAMFIYPGGTIHDHNTTGYSFFINFFSDLGVIHTWSNEPNYVSATLFATALILAGLSIILFSLAFSQFFSRTEQGHLLNKFGMYSGIITGILFMGVALTPADILFPFHLQFTIWAFRFFTLAALFWSIAIFRNKEYPNGYAWVFITFFIFLVCFILVGIYGPNVEESKIANIIQATSQKIIAYVSVISILLQSLCALAINRKRQKL